MELTDHEKNIILALRRGAEDANMSEAERLSRQKFAAEDAMAKRPGDWTEAERNSVRSELIRVLKAP